MQALKFLENKFDYLPKRVKIELFLFPLIVLFIFVSLLSEDKEDKNSFVPIKKIDLSKVKMKEDIVDILKNIEKFASENNIYLDKMKNSNISISFESFSSLENRLVFLNYLENYNSFSKIKSFEIFDEKMLVEVEFKKFYKKAFLDYTLDLNFPKKKNKNLKLEAIIGNKAFINNRWVRVNEKVDSFVLSKIENDLVFLKNKYKSIQLRLYKNEDI